MENALKYFEEIEDPRSIKNQKRPLMMLLGTSLLGSLAGIDSFSGFADFKEAHYEKLQDYFDFPHRVPSHDTYQRLWDNINPIEFYSAFSLFTESLVSMNSHFINMDGKTIRHSGSEKALHILTAWCQSNQLALAQVKVDEKSNEITALPQLIRLLDLKEKIITIDAMGAQRDICHQIIEQGGDYVISLKGNQGTFHQDVALFFEVY